MTLTATIRFNSDLPIEDVFLIAKDIVQTPPGYEPEVSHHMEGVIEVYTTMRNPVVIGAKALIWVTQYAPIVVRDLDVNYQVCFDVPYSSDTDLGQLMTELIERLALTEWRYNYDWDDDEWIVNQLPQVNQGKTEEGCDE